VINTGGGEIDMGSKNFGDTILGEAVNQAVSSTAVKLENEAPRLPTHVLTISGLIADVNGQTLVMNVGAKVGLRVGMVLQVSHPGREIRDPATGKVLRRIDTALGTVSLTEVEDDSSVGTFTGYGGKVAVGDAVRNAQ
jgi:hypothetical protein